jgi:hypothetical protein
MSEQRNPDGPTEVRHTIGARGNFALRNVSGRVRLAGIDGDEVIVVCRRDSGRQPQLNVERSEGGLLVEPERIGQSIFSIGGPSIGSLEFEVQLPRGAHLDIKTVSADIDAQDLTGDQAYKTVSGDIRLRGASGRVHAVTVSGDARLHDGGELEFDGASTSGDVTVEATLVRRLGVRTISGDVRVVGRLEAGPRHAVETVSGDMQLETDGGVTVESTRALDLGRRNRQPTIVGDGAARLMFRSLSGNQRVRSRGGQAAAPTTPERSATSSTSDDTRLEILRALERGEIDVDEASRRLAGAHHG